MVWDDGSEEVEIEEEEEEAEAERQRSQVFDIVVVEVEELGSIMIPERRGDRAVNPVDLLSDNKVCNSFWAPIHCN